MITVKELIDYLKERNSEELIRTVEVKFQNYDRLIVSQGIVTSLKDQDKKEKVDGKRGNTPTE